MTSSNQLHYESLFKIGNVFSVKGRKVQIKVDNNRNLSVIFFRGDIIKNISVNSYIKIAKGFLRIIGKIEGEYIEPIDLSQSPLYTNQKESFIRFLDVSLLGYFDSQSRFYLGIQELPLVDNECYILEDEELQTIYSPQNNNETISIGKSPFDNKIVTIDINRLFASHIGIFGNTGSGKSHTLAKLYHELFQKYKGNPNFQKTAQFILIDFNGEYIKGNSVIEKEYKTSYDLKVSPQDNTEQSFPRYPVSDAVINDIEILSLLFQAKSQTQVPFLKRATNNSYYNFSVFQNNSTIQEFILHLITSYFRDKKKREILQNLVDILHNYTNNSGLELQEIKQHFSVPINVPLTPEEMKTVTGYSQQTEMINSKGEKEIELRLKKLAQYIHGIDFGKNPLKLLELKIILKYYDEILSGFSEEQHIGPLIKRIQTIIPELDSMIMITEGMEPATNFLRIISLKHVDIKLKKFLPLLIAKDAYKQAKQGKFKFLNLIIDEAHNILSEESDRETEYWKDYRLETFEEIIKEGRKFGVFLTIASQRPADISPTILSQLHNYFLHRLVNDRDIYAVQKAISYLDKISFEYLPIMPRGTTIFAGTAANMPAIIAVDKIEEEFKPYNDTIILTNIWKNN